MAGSPVMRVLSVTSEAVPLVKTGGLADVAGALPGALAPLGVDMRVLIPGYRSVMKDTQETKVVAQIKSLFGGAAKILSGQVAGLDLLILDAPHLYDRCAGIYLDDQGRDWSDNTERFAALSLVAAEIAGGAVKSWLPDVVHCHDWQAGLAPYYIKKADLSAKTVLTVHNIAFQGIVPASKLKDLGIAQSDFTADGLEYYGNLSTLKAGLTFADKITTVSPTYARELTTVDFGMGLHGVIQARGGDVSGILNGIDTDVWSPANDPLIKPYKTAAGKRKNKTALRKVFELPKTDGPLCIVISRLTEQKGLDLLLQALPALTDRGGQLALLGSGNPALEHAFLEASAHPNIAVRIGYDEPLSHQMMAGGDAILVPSRFEPCGLTQLYGLAYGALPVVALTGGLADTVIPATPATMAKQVATGLQFNPITADALAHSLIQLCEMFAQPRVWARMQRNAMSQPVDWGPSAERYAALYGELLA